MPNAVLTRSHALPSGLRVRLRLARLSDQQAVEALLGRCGVAASELEVRRLLAYDPTSRAVLAASALLDGADRLVGVGGMALDAGADVDTLVVDETRAPGIGELLAAGLRDRAAAHARPRRVVA